MPLLDGLFRKQERAIGPSNTAWDRGDTAGDFFEPVGVRVDRDSALGVSAVWACVSLIADSIATLPLGLFTTVDDAPQALPGQAWMSQPNTEQTLVEFMFGVVTSLLLHGNAYIYTVRDRFQNVTEVWVLDPRWVYVRRDYYQGKLQLVYYINVGKGMQSPVGPQIVPAGPDMFHITAFQPSSSWPMGISPLDNARMLWGSAIAGQEMGARWFGQGFNAAGVLETDDDVLLEQAQQIKRDFADANTGGPRKMHLPPLLTGGLTWKQIQITPEQAQFLGQRQFAIDEVARWFRVPPHMIGNLEKTSSWGAGIEQQSIGFATYTLRPWLSRIEASFRAHMLPFQPEAFFSFDTLDLMRGDMATLADFGQKTHSFGGLNANEWRTKYLRMPRFEGGDTHYFMVNTAPVGTEPIKINKPSVDEGNVPPEDVPPSAAKTQPEQNSRHATVEFVVPGISASDKNDLVESVASRMESEFAERDARSKELADAVTTASGAAQDAARAAAESGGAVGDVRNLITAELAGVRSDVTDGIAAAQEFTKGQLAAITKQIKAIESESEAAVRADKRPKLRSVKLPGGKTAALLIDGDSRILEMPDGRRIVVESEELNG